MRILVVDDDPELAELVSTSLTRDGHRVTTARDLREARAAFNHEVDLVVLDLGLPDGSGLTLCTELRDDGQSVPILLLTAQSAVAQRVEGLNAGADDYLPKPFALAELRARVRALGRRRDNPPLTIYEVGDVRLDVSRRRALRSGAEVELTTREWEILETLGVRGGRVVSRETILETVWDEISDANAASLEVLIARIRRKLGKALIRTIRGTGYAIGESVG